MTKRVCFDVNEFRKVYPTTSVEELAIRYGVTEDTIRHWASRHGIKKDRIYTRQVQSNKAIGRKMSEETKRKIVATKIRKGTTSKGEKHYKWKGGNAWKRFADPQYIEWRNKVLQRDNYTCQDCGRQCNKSEKGLAAHHLKPYSQYPELRFALNNGLTLCRKCHMLRHGKTVPDEKVLCACGCGTVIDAFDKYGGRPREYVNGHSRRGKVGYVQEVILCACGCGGTKNRFDKKGRESLYLRGHQVKGTKKTEEQKEAMRSQRTGKALSPDHRQKIKEGLASSENKVGRKPIEGWTCEHVTEAQFIELYPQLPTTKMAEMCRATRATINRWAKNLGIQKSSKRYP